jgi:hypothetical protein
MQSPTYTWPEAYVPAITKILDAVPEVYELLGQMKWKEVSRAALFGGFCRWIVETSGTEAALKNFIEYGGDFDIFIDDFPDAPCKLREYFLQIVKRGGVIEYVGMNYGDTHLSDEIFDLEDPCERLPYGNYITFIPNRVGDGWIKLDITFGSLVISTDFMPNVLRYPSGQSLLNERAIDCIKSRLILPATLRIDMKHIYRAIKLIRRGYKFADAEYCVELLAAPLRPTTKRRQGGSHGIIGRILLDTSAPSVRAGKGETATKIYPTEGRAPKVTMEFMSRQPEFAEMILLSRSAVNVAGCGRLQDGIIPVTTAPLRVYKAVWSPELAQHLCVELSIPIGTRYACANGNYTEFRFDRAEVSRTFTYPMSEIDPSGITLVSMYDTTFTYRGTIEAKNNGRIEPITATSTHGIYGLISLTKAWDYVSHRWGNM